MKGVLSAQDLEQIREAVASAETKTSGEIVPYVARDCGRYDVAVWRAGGIGALVAFGLITLFLQLNTAWGGGWWMDGRVQMLAMATTGAGLALLAAFVPTVKRLFTGQRLLMLNVHRRAMATFVEKEVFSTRERTGILLFVSLFEHRIEVIGDKMINEKVEQDEWDDVVRSIRDGVKSGNLAAGLVRGIGMCSKLLEKSGVEIRPDDTNELPDDVGFDA